jgi:muconolactone D-isomerase
MIAVMADRAPAGTGAPLGFRAARRPTQGQRNCQDCSPGLLARICPEVAAVEYLVTMTTRVPHGASAQAVAELHAREVARYRELALRRQLLRLWRLPVEPGQPCTVALLVAEDGGQLEEILASMPLRVWRTDEIMPLLAHPDDPPTRAGTSVIA